MSIPDRTYRVVDLSDGNSAGKSAATPELAKQVAGAFDRNHVLGMERTDWISHLGQLRADLSVVVGAEKFSGEWVLGVRRMPVPKGPIVERRLDS